MRLVVTIEHRFDRTPDGAVWTQTMYPWSFWCRYLEVFDSVCVVARTRTVSDIPADWKRSDGRAVSFSTVPYYVGPQQYLLVAHQVAIAVNKAVKMNDAVILRLGSPIAGPLANSLVRTERPYGVEVVGDPYDAFAPGAIKHPLRPFFRWWFSRQLRQQCAKACAAAYVTQYALQRRYPPAPEAFTTHYSSIELPDDAIARAPRPIVQNRHRHTIIFVGTLAQLYKGPDVLIDTVAACEQSGIDLDLVIVGDGHYKPKLEQRAVDLNIRDRIHFLGQLSAGETVRRQLDQADLFVLPSRQEGLPRAMVEAMARALPCIGSTVGGIPELLDAEDMVPPDDVNALASKIRDIVSNPERMADMSRRNLSRAQQYKESLLCKRRKVFYQYVKEKTQEWQHKSASR